MSLQQVERFLLLTDLRVDRRQIVRGWQQRFVILGNFQRFVAVPVACKKGCGKNQVVGIGRVDLGRFARVLVSFRLVAFGVPINGQIAVRERERIFLH